MPRHDPLITGLADYYEDGDWVSANCTTDRSSPPASITWFFNGKRRHTDYPNVYHEENVDVDAQHLQMRSLELHFQLDRHQHFLGDRNTLELRCSAQVDGLPAVPQRDTVRNVRLREVKDDRIINQKQTTYLRDSSGAGGLSHPLLWLPVLLLLPAVVRITQLS